MMVAVSPGRSAESSGPDGQVSLRASLGIGTSSSDSIRSQSAEAVMASWRAWGDRKENGGYEQRKCHHVRAWGRPGANYCSLALFSAHIVHHPSVADEQITGN